jgi:hypothetical protein
MSGAARNRSRDERAIDRSQNRQHAAVWGAVTGLFAMIPYLGYVAVAGIAF